MPAFFTGFPKSGAKVNKWFEWFEWLALQMLF